MIFFFSLNFVYILKIAVVFLWGIFFHQAIFIINGIQMIQMSLARLKKKTQVLAEMKHEVI